MNDLLIQGTIVPNSNYNPTLEANYTSRVGVYDAMNFGGNAFSLTNGNKEIAKQCCGAKKRETIDIATGQIKATGDGFGACCGGKGKSEDKVVPQKNCSGNCSSCTGCNGTKKESISNELTSSKDGFTQSFNSKPTSANQNLITEEKLKKIIIEQNLTADKINFTYPTNEQAINSLSPDFFKMLRNPNSFNLSNFKIEKYNTHNYFQIGNLKSKNNISDVKDNSNFSEIKVYNADNTVTYPLTSAIQNDGSLVTKMSIENRDVLYIRYIRNGIEGWIPDTDTKLTKKGIPYETSLELFNIIGLSTFVASSIIENTKNVNTMSSNKSNSTQSEEGGENYKECNKYCPDENGTAQISHGLYCNLPYVNIITSDGRVKIFSPCAGTLTFDVGNCCRQHDIDLWCSEKRSVLDLDKSTSIDDYIIAALKAATLTTTLIDADRYTNILDSKSAEGADLKVVLCVLNGILDMYVQTLIRNMDWGCFLAFGLVSIASLIFGVSAWVISAVLRVFFADLIQALIGTTLAMVGALFVNAAHDPCLLGLNGRNKNSCLCGGTDPTLCCTAYINWRDKDNYLNCFELDKNGEPIVYSYNDIKELSAEEQDLFAEYVSDFEKRGLDPQKDPNNGKIYRRKYLCGNNPYSKRKCKFDCVFDEKGALTSTPQPDIPGLNRQCSNSQLECNGSKCQNCRAECHYVDRDLVGMTYYGGPLSTFPKDKKSDVCCKGTGYKTISECAVVNPHWNDDKCRLPKHWNDPDCINKRRYNNADAINDKNNRYKWYLEWQI